VLGIASVILFTSLLSSCRAKHTDSWGASGQPVLVLVESSDYLQQ